MSLDNYRSNSTEISLTNMYTTIRNIQSGKKSPLEKREKEIFEEHSQHKHHLQYLPHVPHSVNFVDE